MCNVMSERKPTLCVVAGPNGSGKTSTSSPEINVSRITKRFSEGGHEVPISKIISRYYKFLTNMAKVISFVDRAYIYDNSVENQLARLLYRTTDGEIFKQYVEDVPEWAKALLTK